MRLQRGLVCKLNCLEDLWEPCRGRWVLRTVTVGMGLGRKGFKTLSILFWMRPRLPRISGVVAHKPSSWSSINRTSLAKAPRCTDCTYCKPTLQTCTMKEQVRGWSRNWGQHRMGTPALRASNAEFHNESWSLPQRHGAAVAVVAPTLSPCPAVLILLSSAHFLVPLPLLIGSPTKMAAHLPSNPPKSLKSALLLVPPGCQNRCTWQRRGHAHLAMVSVSLLRLSSHHEHPAHRLECMVLLPAQAFRDACSHHHHSNPEEELAMFWLWKGRQSRDLWNEIHNGTCIFGRAFADKSITKKPPCMQRYGEDCCRVNDKKEKNDIHKMSKWWDYDNERLIGLDYDPNRLWYHVRFMEDHKLI